MSMFDYLNKRKRTIKLIFTYVRAYLHSNHEKYIRLLFSEKKFDCCLSPGHVPQIYYLLHSTNLLIYPRECSRCKTPLDESHERFFIIPPPTLTDRPVITQEEWKKHAKELESEIRLAEKVLKSPILIIDMSWRIEQIYLEKKLRGLSTNPIYVSPEFWDFYPNKF